MALVVDLDELKKEKGVNSLKTRRPLESVSGRARTEHTEMRDHYDLSSMEGRKNPFAKQLKQPVTMQLDNDTVMYFQQMAEETGIPYQNLINLYLRDCADHHRKLKMEWNST